MAFNTFSSVKYVTGYWFHLRFKKCESIRTDTELCICSYQPIKFEKSTNFGDVKFRFNLQKF